MFPDEFHKPFYRHLFPIQIFLDIETINHLMKKKAGLKTIKHKLLQIKV